MLSHSYKLHGSGLAPWLPGHSQLSMKPTLQALPGLESWLHGVPVRCSVLYNMHHEGSSPGPGRAWGGAFMAFTISWHLQKPPLQALEGNWRGGFMVFLLGALCYTICTMKAPPGEEPFMVFKLAKVLGNSHATHGSGLALINCIVADHSQL